MHVREVRDDVDVLIDDVDRAHLVFFARGGIWNVRSPASAEATSFFSSPLPQYRPCASDRSRVCRSGDSAGSFAAAALSAPSAPCLPDRPSPACRRPTLRARRRSRTRRAAALIAKTGMQGRSRSDASPPDCSAGSRARESTVFGSRRQVRRREIVFPLAGMFTTGSVMT